jgi:hypothetical protein
MSCKIASLANRAIEEIYTMPTESSKFLTSWPVDRPTKNRLLDLQVKYRKRYGRNIAQDKIAAALLQRATVSDLPSPQDLEAKAA